MYYKEHLPIIKRDDLCTLKEWLVTEIIVGKEKLFFSCLYRSPSQTKEEFEEFFTDLNLLLSNVDLNIPLSVVTSDFNARSSKWWSLDKGNDEGREISSLTSACGDSQIINQPKESSSCIDFVFTTSPNFISHTSVDLLLIDECHQSLICGIIDFKVPLPPPYLREVWDYENANSSYIQSAVSNTDWNVLLRRADVNKKFVTLNECLKNILHNFIPNRMIKCSYRYPPWMTDDVKTKLKERSKLA